MVVILHVVCLLLPQLAGEFVGAAERGGDSRLVVRDVDDVVPT